jgi:pimeloyl-ACP methyl ester carboxylesterase
MKEINRLIFIHGLEGTSQGVKATLLRGLFPEILIPDFAGSLDARMARLEEHLHGKDRWIIVGSSFGGLMGALYACRYPERVSKLILLAPALIWPDFAANPPAPIALPVVVVHGERDELIPIEVVRKMSKRVFTNHEFRAVDDDHGLYKTSHALDWRKLLGS